MSRRGANGFQNVRGRRAYLSGAKGVYAVSTSGAAKPVGEVFTRRHSGTDPQTRKIWAHDCWEFTIEGVRQNACKPTMWRALEELVDLTFPKAT